MKKITFVVLFSMFLLSVYGQQRAENRWLVGSWNTQIDGQNIEIVLNDNGTGRVNTQEIIFSYIENENRLLIYTADGRGTFRFYVGDQRVYSSFTVRRINDQRMILSGFLGGFVHTNFNFIKRD